MRARTWIWIGLLLVGTALAAAPQAVEAASPAPATPAAARVAATPPPLVCAAPSFEASAGERGAERCSCSATADCGGSSISCSDTTGPCSCSAKDRHCPFQRGYVQCNGVTQYCPEACGCFYIRCENGRSCTTNDDCCSATGPGGICFNGECSCLELE
jgi:hypothetical protein